MSSNEQCTCPKTCDCQNPPPDNPVEYTGIWGVSNQCPTHNLYPDPDPNCPVHGKMDCLEFNLVI